MADDLMQLRYHILVLYFANVDLKQKVDQHLFAELHVGQLRIDLSDDFDSVYSEEVRIALIDQLAHSAKKLAVDSITLHVNKLILKEDQK